MLNATVLEVSLAEALDTNPLIIRYFATRFLAELLLGRNLTKRERAKLNSKICNSFPRDRVNGGYVRWPDDPVDDDFRGGVEILKVIDRAKLDFSLYQPKPKEGGIADAQEEE